VLALSPAGADYARPADHGGLRDIVLIYRGAAPRTAQELVPLVAFVDAAGRPQQWFFDAFLLLPAFNAAGAANFHDGPNTLADWRTWLEEVEGLVAALEAAVETVRKQVGSPPCPRQVLIAIPYPPPGQKAFGDLDGDGKAEALASDRERGAAVDWFMGEVLSRWEKRPPQDLALWGFYWHRECVQSQDEALVRRTCQRAHDGGQKMLWIPWFRAEGWDRWQALGFDLAILQPNYAFLPLLDGHLPDEGRLSETAELARSVGMGVEMETNYALATRARDRALLRLYLNHAVTDGYAGAVRAHFHSFDQYQALARSDHREARQLYEDLWALHEGRLAWRPLSRLDGAQVEVGGRVGTRAVPGLTRRPTTTEPEVSISAGEHLDLVLPSPQRLEEVRLFLTGPPPRAVDVYGQEPGGRWQWLTSVAEGPVQQPGWILAPWPPQVLSRLRLRCAPFPGQTTRLTRLVSYPATQPPPADPPPAEAPDINLARGRPYVVRPDPPRKYPDDGRELTDGVLTEGGFPDGRTVGWSAPRVELRLDLGRPVALESVRVHVQGGGWAGVHVPYRLSVAGSRKGTRWRLLHQHPAEFEETGKIAGVEGATWGWMVVPVEPSVEPVRWLRITLEPHGWLMVSEVEALSGGRNAARGLSYTMVPRPHADTPYSDDGRKLTDGVAVPAWNQAVGWSEGQGEIEVDLGKVEKVGRVRVYALGGGRGGVYLPAGGEVALSRDGVNWDAPIAAPVPEEAEEDATWGRWVSCDGGGAEGRYVKIQLRRNRGWLMVGEVEVLAAR